MQRYFITLSYDGAGYHGWQIQPNGISVQERLQQALSTLLRQPIEVVGAGRTDAGVHAAMMVAHFDLPTADDGDDVSVPEDFSPKQLAYRLNRILPRDIAVQRVEAVAPEMHARFSAVSRTYYYYLHTEKNPFLRTTSWETHYQLDFPAMNEAAAWLLTQSDFASFCKVGADVKTTLCQLTRAEAVIASPLPTSSASSRASVAPQLARACLPTPCSSLTLNTEFRTSHVAHSCLYVGSPVGLLRFL